MSIYLGAQPREQRIATAHLPPFDPEELTRKLYIVQAEQRAYVEKKRRARVEVKRQAKIASLGEPSSERIANNTRPISYPNAMGGHDKDDRTEIRNSHNRPSVHIPSFQQSCRLDETTSSTESRAKVDNDRPSSSYRHVPQVAASQFTRTTTVGSPDDAHIHSLSKKALKFHIEGLNADQELLTAESNLAPRNVARTLRRVQSQREEHYERNQFQHPSMMDSVAAIEDERLRLAQRHTFETTFGKEEQACETDHAPKRSSMGANQFSPVFAELASNALYMDRNDCRGFGAIGGIAQECRVDWTQSDEYPKSPDDTTPTLLRKVDSKWSLTGRFVKSQKHSKPRTLSSPTEESATEDSPVSPKSLRPGFFSRFKR